MIPLRDYQIKAENQIREAYRSGYRAPLFVLPTGGGKTHTFTSIAVKAAEKKNRTLIVVHRSYLWQQASNKLKDIGAPHGVISPNEPLTHDLIQIASIDTLIRRFDKIKKPDLIIFDEAHHVVKNNKWGKVVDEFPDARILGVTATPVRTTGQGLGVNSGGFFDSLIMGPQIYEMMPEYLTPFKLFAPKSDIDLSQVKRVAGDFDKTELLKMIDTKSITGSATEQYKKICNGVPAIAFCVSIEHSHHVAEEFNRSGITAAAVSGKTPENRRKYLFDGLASGIFKVLCSCDLVSEGFDVPVCGAAICLRPTQSTGLCLQQWGRATRKAPNKNFAYIIDHVGNYLRHGLPDEHRDWTLDGMHGKRDGKKEVSIGIRTCKVCFMVHKTAPICPSCGYTYGVNDKTPEQIEGELEEIKLREVQEKKAVRIEQGQCKTLEDLERFAKQQGYNKFWARHVFNGRRANK